MINHILHKIRRMEIKYCEKTGNRGEVICLDANAEAKLAAYIVNSLKDEAEIYKEIYSNFTHIENEDKRIEEILESGIRGLDITIYGMRLKFDCPSFCVEGPVVLKKDWMISP